MNPETFAEWLRRQGHLVVRTDSSYWYSAGPRVLQAFPYHWQIRPSEEEIRALMKDRGIFALRYSTPIDYPNGSVSYHIALRHPYTMDGLNSKARNGVKRGLKCFNVEQISFERLAMEGWLLQEDTLCRQNRLGCMTQAEWEQLCRSADGLPGFEAWAATADSNLAAALIICRINDVFNVPYALSHRDYLREHVNNALFYTVSCEMLGRECIREIFFTVQSLDAPPSVDDFKFRMGLLPVAVRQRVDFHPWLAPFATPMLHNLTATLLKHSDGNRLLPKAEGMLRFHVQGKRPLAEQEWPKCVDSLKEDLLEKYEENFNMNYLDECQLPNLPKFSEGVVPVNSQSFVGRLKQILAVPWNYYVKRWLKKTYHLVSEVSSEEKSAQPANEIVFNTGDWVRVRTPDEIRATLDPFKELKGCAFLDGMYQYCGTKQRVLQVMERFLDERDYKVKKVKGIVLLEGAICHGTPAFGRCDRCCHLFWRQEWLENATIA